MTAVRMPARPSLGLMVALLLVLLAAAAWWWPEDSVRREGGSFLVLQPVADPRREDALARLTDFLSHEASLRLRLLVVRDVAALNGNLPDAALVMAPDATLLPLDPADWQPLVAGRRRMPWNLRPTSVLVSRRDRPGGLRPWRDAPQATVVGDSLSLVCLAPLGPGGLAAAREAGVTWGHDPYDHGPVLAALISGAFDHAVVRQWDAAALVAAGELDPARWSVQALSDPMPDVLVMASRRLPAATRLNLQQILSLLGRTRDAPEPEQERVTVGLGLLGLDGFNLVTGPDIERIRRRLGDCWPHGTP